MYARIAAMTAEGFASVVAGRRFWTAFFTLLGATTLTALAVVYSTFTSRQRFNDLQDLEKQRNRLQVEYRQLLLEQSSLVSQGKVEDTAIAELGMQVPDMNQVVVFTRD